MSDDRDREAAFITEVRRIQERYAIEIVEQFNFCPWARGAREEGTVLRPILLQRDEDVAPTLGVLDELEADPAQPPVAIVTYPHLRITPRAFDSFAARVREADQTRRREKPIYVSATFHPDYPLDSASPSRLVTYLRRSPDPSLQLVRLAVLEQARGRDKGKFHFDYSSESWEELLRRIDTVPLAERIARDNLATFEQEGAARFEAIYADIQEDRRRTYARFASDDS